MKPKNEDDRGSSIVTFGTLKRFVGPQAAFRPLRIDEKALLN